MLDLVRDLELLTADDDEGGAHAQLPLANLLALVSDFTYLTDVILTTSLGTVGGSCQCSGSAWLPVRMDFGWLEVKKNTQQK
jgi:hypothetical protein